MSLSCNSLQKGPGLNRVYLFCASIWKRETHVKREVRKNNTTSKKSINAANNKVAYSCFFIVVTKSYLDLRKAEDKNNLKSRIEKPKIWKQL